MDKKRNYGVDLLRIVLMIFIIIGHLYAHTDIRNTLGFLSGSWIFTWITQAVTVCAVDCFIIITGYYMSQNKYDLFKLLKLWAKVINYSVLLTIILVIVKEITINTTTLLDAFFPVFRKEYWFFTMYILLSLFVPFLNIAINNMTKKTHEILVIIIVLFFYLEPLLSVVFYQYDTTEGFSIIAFITLYIIGAFLSRCNDIPKKICFIAIIGSSAIMFVSKVLLELFVKHYELSLGTSLLYHNNSIFVLINAIAIFELFKQIDLKPFICKLVVWFNSSVFSVYLIHEKPAVRNLIWNKELIYFLNSSSLIGYIFIVFGVAISIFTISVLIDKLISLIIFQRIHNCFISNFINGKCKLFNDIINS